MKTSSVIPKRSKSLRNRNTETLSKGRCRLKREETDMKETNYLTVDDTDDRAYGTDGDNYGAN
jgi:hypothetical protein